MFDTVRDYFEEFEIEKMKGARGFQEFTLLFSTEPSNILDEPRYSSKQLDVDNIVSQLEAISSRLLASKFSTPEDRHLVFSIFLSFYSTYIQDSLELIMSAWDAFKKTPYNGTIYMSLTQNAQILRDQLEIIESEKREGSFI